jgi:hypothetical protein
MIKCKACQLENRNFRQVVTGDHASGWICIECRDLAVSQFIAARDAEKPKAPTLTLEEKMRSYLITNHAVYFAPSTIDRVIAMVREHDATALKPTTPNDVLQLQVEVLERSLKERTAERNIAREMMKQARVTLGGD